VPLPNYDAVLTLLVVRDAIESWNDDPDTLDELDPREFTLDRKRWPSKR